MKNWNFSDKIFLKDNVEEKIFKLDDDWKIILIQWEIN